MRPSFASLAIVLSFACGSKSAPPPDAPLSALELTLDAVSAPPNKPVGYSYQLRDTAGLSFGGKPTVNVTTSPATTTVDQNAHTITFSAPGYYVVTADAGNGVTDEKSITITDNTPPMVSIASPQPFPAPGSRFRQGDTVSIHVTGGDDIGVAQVQLLVRDAFTYDDVRFENGATTFDETFTFQTDSGFFATSHLGPMYATAIAIDASGNSAQATVKLSIDPALNTFTLGTGYSYETLGGGFSSGLNPRGVIVEAIGHIAIANGTSCTIGTCTPSYVADLDPATGFHNRISDPLGAAFTVDARDIAIDPNVAGGFLVSANDTTGATGGREILRVGATGAVTQALVITPAPAPNAGFQALTVDAGNNRVIVADATQQEVRAFSMAAVPFTEITANGFPQSFNGITPDGVAWKSTTTTLYATDTAANELDARALPTGAVQTQAVQNAGHVVVTPGNLLVIARTAQVTAFDLTACATLGACTPIPIIAGLSQTSSVTIDATTTPPSLIVSDDQIPAVVRVTGAF